VLTPNQVLCIKFQVLQDHLFTPPPLGALSSDDTAVAAEETASGTGAGADADAGASDLA
jgi:hypothetical protein